MNKNDFSAFMESDDILNNFLTNILITKVNTLTDPSEIPYIRARAHEWLYNYFDNYTDMYAEDVLKKISYFCGRKKMLVP